LISGFNAMKKINKLTIKNKSLKKRFFLIVVLLFCLSSIVIIPYYFLYYKQSIIYDLVSINFYGISSINQQHIKISGITPMNKNIEILRKEGADCIPGSFNSIQITIPKSLVSKDITIIFLLKSNIYLFNIENLKLIGSYSTENVYTLPSYVKSTGGLINKTILVFPFSNIISIIKTVLQSIKNHIQLLLYMACVIIILIIAITEFNNRYLHNN